MSEILGCSEQVCRDRVSHLVQVLQKQLAGRSMELDEELLDEIKQEMAQRSRASGDNFQGESENELESDEEGEDDDIMKLVLWKFYQRLGALDPADVETHESLSEELDAVEWISPQLLETAAGVFIKRRAMSRGAQGGSDLGGK